ncbi:MAG TPA: KUP/HAK/KT family potassium transporter, partial [Candidatus Obscuribacter sp.]|nr:KUP/HAK/KT family potassium transporter [Candidatus Obscuribacter sp.]
MSGFESSHLSDSKQHLPRSRHALTLVALGLVYGDIGTSPLYALQLTMKSLGHASPSPQDALGIVSLITWVILIVVAVKYCLLVLRADNEGEGGILALTSLIANGGHESLRLCGMGLV